VFFPSIFLKNDFQSKIRNHLNKQGYRPSNKSELARDLRVSPKDRAEFRKALAQLESKGEVVCRKKSRYRLVDSKQEESRKDGNPLTGHIQFSRNERQRSAFFIPDAPDEIPQLQGVDRPRIFIPGRSTSTAMNGDRVSVRLEKRRPPKWHRYVKGIKDTRRDGDTDSLEGRVIEILERGNPRIVGIYHRKGGSSIVVPDETSLPRTFRLTEVLPEVKGGDMIVAEFISWESSHLPPVAKMTEVLGRPNAPHVDMLAVIHRYGLPLRFPNAVMSEADAISEEVQPSDLINREDWRDREVFTIDPEDARDFDDAISVKEMEGGKGWELAVHIADVSHYVKPGSALDKEAHRRGNSVYLADRVIPMLPEKLSNGVCSLKPQVDRLTHAAVMEFDSEGKLKSVRFAQAVICSAWRYSYEEAYTRLMLSDAAIKAFEDERERRLSLHLKRAWKLAEILRRRRFEAGSLDLDFPEVRVVLNEEGIPVGVKRSDYDESHQLIEEFMLAANEMVAREIKNSKAVSIYRVHEDPDPAKLDEFADLARTFGHHCGDLNHRPELQKLLKSIKGTLEEHSLKIGFLKSLRRAGYSREPLGHYGLSKVNYTHFTSPIRRYADLIVHRSLKRILSRQKNQFAPEHPDRTPGEAATIEIAEHISKTERIAADAEKETQKLKMLEYIERLCQDDQSQTFQATTTELRPIGVFIELKDLKIRGMIRKQDLPSRNDYFYDRGRNEFRNRGGRNSIGLGDTVEVRLVRVDRSRGFVDFELAGN